jgi:TonB family protein
MTETWKQWEGQTVNGAFHLRRYVGCSEHGAVFLTDHGDRSPQTTVMKLVAENSPNAKSQLTSWRLATILSHPNLIEVFQAGQCQIGDVNLLYAVTEWAEEDLSQIIPLRALTQAEARDMLKPVLDALAYLHAKGLVLGPLKPADIMASGNQLKLSTDRLRRAGEPIGKRDAQGEPVVPLTLASPFLDIARHCLRRDSRLRWKVADIADRFPPPAAVQTTVQPVPRNPAPTRGWHWIPAAVILLLALTGFASLKLLNRSPKAGAALSPAAEELSKKTLQQSRQDGSAAPLEPRQATPSEHQTARSTLPRPAPAPSGDAPPVAAADRGVTHQVLPDVPQKARDTIRGTVRVGIKVSVDPSGKVTDATIDSPGSSRYFADLALRAARQWKFAPTGDAAGEWIVRFDFSGDGARASAKRSAP